MLKNSISLVFAFCTLTLLSSCDGDSGKTPDSLAYTDINAASGFSAAYLNGKSFYWPKGPTGSSFIEVLEFTDTTVSWNDDSVFSDRIVSSTANYDIVTANGINGIIRYNDGFYDLFFNVQSVESDHIMVCYSHTGIDSVIACTANQAYPWYFDRATALANP